MKGENSMATKAPSKEVYSLATYQDVQTLLDKPSIKERIAKLVPSSMSADRFVRVVLNAWTRTPELRQCTPASFVLAVLEAGALGLEPDGLLGQGWIIPYKKTAKFIPGYRGLMQLGYRTGEIVSWKAVVVHSNDKYHFQEGLHPVIEHEPTSAEDDGDVVAAYSIIVYKDGAADFEWMWKKDLEKVRKKSQYPEGGPWRDHTEEMYKKTVIRRHAKRARLSIEDVNRAASLDERREFEPESAGTFLPEDIVGDLLEGDLPQDAPNLPKGIRQAEKADKLVFEQTIPDSANLELVDKFIQQCIDENPGYTPEKVKADAVLSKEDNERFWSAFKEFQVDQQTFKEESSVPPAAAEEKPKGKPKWRTQNAAGQDSIICKARGGKAMAPAICEACTQACTEYKDYRKFVETGKV